MDLFIRPGKIKAYKRIYTCSIKKVAVSTIRAFVIPHEGANKMLR